MAPLGYAAFSKVDMLASRYTPVNFGAETGAHSSDGAVEKAVTPVVHLELGPTLLQVVPHPRDRDCALVPGALLPGFRV